MPLSFSAFGAAAILLMLGCLLIAEIISAHKKYFPFSKK
jgi:hypothetical protein